MSGYPVHPHSPSFKGKMRKESAEMDDNVLDMTTDEIKVLNRLASFHDLRKAKKDGKFQSQSSMSKYGDDSASLNSSYKNIVNQYTSLKKQLEQVITGKKILSHEQKRRQELIDKAKRLGISESYYTTKTKR